jgi:hypothetical protein
MATAIELHSLQKVRTLIQQQETPQPGTFLRFATSSSVQPFMMACPKATSPCSEQKHRKITIVDCNTFDGDTWAAFTQPLLNIQQRNL